MPFVLPQTVIMTLVWRHKLSHVTTDFLKFTEKWEVFQQFFCLET